MSFDLADEQDYANGKSHGLLEGWSNGFEEGYIAAIDAAEAAVANMEIEMVGNSAATVEQAVAVIRALKKKP